MLRILGNGRWLEGYGSSVMNRRELMQIGELGLAGATPLIADTPSQAETSNQVDSTFGKAKNCILVIHLRCVESAGHAGSETSRSR